jgi:outer membrane lipoprotein-sorting protein
MKRTILLMIALMFVGMTAQAASIDKLMDKVINAYGGEKKLNGITAMKMDLSIAVGAMNQNIKLTAKDPDLFLLETEAMGQKMKAACDGKKYMMDQGGNVMELPPQAQDQVKIQADQFQEFVKMGLTDYKTDGNTYKKIGRETVDGVDCIKVEVTKKDSEEKSVLYIDKAKYLIHQIVTDVTQGGQKTTTTVKIRDYKKVNGIMVAHKIEIKGQQNVTMTINKLEINPKIDNSVFTLK